MKEFTQIVRPFYPEGDYKMYSYPEGCIVIDNPPFSILSKIVDFYIYRKQPFILFCQSLTAGQFVSDKRQTTIILVNERITFHNKAYINISFIAYGIKEIENFAILTAPKLKIWLKKIEKKTRVLSRNRRPKYVLPKNVTSAALLGKYTDRDFAIKRAECIKIDTIDAMKKEGKNIYGGGFLLSAEAAEAVEAVEAAEAAEVTFTYDLSEREKALLKKISNTL